MNTTVKGETIAPDLDFGKRKAERGLDSLLYKLAKEAFIDRGEHARVCGENWLAAQSTNASSLQRFRPVLTARGHRS